MLGAYCSLQSFAVVETDKCTLHFVTVEDGMHTYTHYGGDHQATVFFLIGLPMWSRAAPLPLPAPPAVDGLIQLVTKICFSLTLRAKNRACLIQDGLPNLCTKVSKVTPNVFEIGGRARYMALMTCVDRRIDSNLCSTPLELFLNV